MRDVSLIDWPHLDPDLRAKVEKTYVISSAKSCLDSCARLEYRKHLRAAGITRAETLSLWRQAREIVANLPEVAIRGTLEDFFETGCEGVMWAVYEDGKSGYDALNILEQDDWLRITDEHGKVLFEGFIDCDRKKGWHEYPMNPGHGQPCALGMWIHWTQKGWEPDDWARLFFRRHLIDNPGPALRAELVINRKRPKTPRG